ncbi:MAG: class I SAM-dependent methyltransferase [Candidatus Nomurabacteria bacterium]
MLTILDTIFSILVLFILLSVFSLLILWVWGNFKADVPFIGVPKETLKEIEKALALNDDSVVYDLGCGDGRVLFYLKKNNPKAKYIGIENSLFPYILVSVNNWFFKLKNKEGIKIIRGNFFNTDIKDATHVFAYLYSHIVDDLLPKFDKELKKGSRFVSMSFHFTSKAETQEIDLKRNSYKIARKIYVYEF